MTVSTCCIAAGFDDDGLGQDHGDLAEHEDDEPLLSQLPATSTAQQASQSSMQVRMHSRRLDPVCINTMQRLASSQIHCIIYPREEEVWMAD